MQGLSLVAASGGHSSSRCAGLSLSRPLLLRNTGSRRAGSVIVAHGPSCSAACGIFPDQGSSPCPLHWQADSQPLRHQGSPWLYFKSLSRIWYLIPSALESLSIVSSQESSSLLVFQNSARHCALWGPSQAVVSLLHALVTCHCSALYLPSGLSPDLRFL